MPLIQTTRDRLGSVSKRVVGSYVLDWFMILLTFAVAASMALIEPNMQPFSLVDPSISLPYTTKAKIPTVALFFISTVTPALVIMLVSLLLSPGPAMHAAATANNNANNATNVNVNVNAAHLDRRRHRTPRALLWRRKLWAWNTAWLGLGLAIVSAQLVTDLLKNFFGKPRPDLLSRCDPDLSRIQENAVGGYGARLDGAVVLVAHTICQKRDKLKDGFRSFPSGHASISWAGLTYLTLFLCSKFAVVVPSVVYRRLGQPNPYPATASSSFSPRHANGLSRASDEDGATTTAYDKGHQRVSSEDRLDDREASSFSSSFPSPPSSSSSSDLPVHEQAAAPPLYLVAICFIPLGVAMYVSSTRYTDYRHHGFDILSGAVLGFVSAWFGFRWYHLPLRERSGRAWAARSPDRAFGVGVGVGSYVAHEDGTSVSTSTATTMAHGTGAYHHHLNEDVELGQTRRHMSSSTSSAAAAAAVAPGPTYLAPIRTERHDGLTL